MFRPRQGKIDPLRQLFGGEINGLGSTKNSRDNIGRQEGKWDQLSHIADMNFGWALIGDGLPQKISANDILPKPEEAG